MGQWAAISRFQSPRMAVIQEDPNRPLGGFGRAAAGLCTYLPTYLRLGDVRAQR